MSDPTIEWVIVADQLAIVSSESGWFRFVDVHDCGHVGPFARPMSGGGTPGSTAGLLNGAVALGFSRDGQMKTSVASLPRYIFDLVGSYHNAHRSPGHFQQAAKRFREVDRPDIASYLERHAREETGHDRLVLKDLRNLGLPAERLVASLFPEGMKRLCEFFDRLAASAHPVGCIGYSYAFEYTAGLKQKSDVEVLEALCPEGVDASRFARTHSGIGSEANHVEDLIAFIAGLPASDRIEVVKTTYETTVMMADYVRGRDAMSDSAIVSIIEGAAGKEIPLRCA
jgi:hypothetical protein